MKPVYDRLFHSNARMNRLEADVDAAVDVAVGVDVGVDVDVDGVASLFKTSSAFVFISRNSSLWFVSFESPSGYKMSGK